MKILLATDGSTCSDRAVDEVAKRPWPAGSKLKIISVAEPPDIPAVELWAVPVTYYEALEHAAHDKALATVESALSKIRSHGADKTLKLSTATPQGSPRQVILDEAEKWGADLIVVGSHGYGTWNRLLLGSVSNAVATHAPCSVEIVRRK
jgi:nucleotide-binding universal stress UspA family protein